MQNSDFISLLFKFWGRIRNLMWNNLDKPFIYRSLIYGSKCYINRNFGPGTKFGGSRKVHHPAVRQIWCHFSVRTLKWHHKFWLYFVLVSWTKYFSCQFQTWVRILVCIFNFSIDNYLLQKPKVTFSVFFRTTFKPYWNSSEGGGHKISFTDQL